MISFCHLNLMEFYIIKFIKNIINNIYISLLIKIYIFLSFKKLFAVGVSEKNAATPPN